MTVSSESAYTLSMPCRRLVSYPSPRRRHHTKCLSSDEVRISVCLNRHQRATFSFVESSSLEYGIDLLLCFTCCLPSLSTASSFNSFSILCMLLAKRVIASNFCAASQEACANAKASGTLLRFGSPLLLLVPETRALAADVLRSRKDYSADTRNGKDVSLERLEEGSCDLCNALLE